MLTTETLYCIVVGKIVVRATGFVSFVPQVPDDNYSINLSVTPLREVNGGGRGG